MLNLNWKGNFRLTLVESGKDIKDFVLNDRVPEEGKETDGLLLFKNIHHLLPLELKGDGSMEERKQFDGLNAHAVS
jgi:hypothetical protein